MGNITPILARQLYNREVTEGIWQWVDDPRVIVLVGARQVGKTSLLYLLIQRLIQCGVNPDSVFYYDLEDFELLELFNRGVANFLRYLQVEGLKSNEKSYVFVDEIQYMDKPSPFLKQIADHHPNLKLICSGSSTLDIRRKFTDSLVGRKVVFEVPTLTFREFLRFRDEETLAGLLKVFPFGEGPGEAPLDIHLRQLLFNYESFLIYGGYPAIALENERERQLRLLSEIYDAYVRKDINQLFTVENLMAFNNLVRLLALQIGNLVNMSELTASLSISRPTLEKYISILENTFILKLVTPFFSNKRKEIVKMPKLYFYDTGLRNQAARQFHPLSARTDTGALVENAVFKALTARRSTLEELKFWRTKSGGEVDFIVDGETVIPIEVKFATMNRPRIPSELRAFIQNYQPPIGIVVTRDFIDEQTLNGTHILFIPACLMA